MHMSENEHIEFIEPSLIEKHFAHGLNPADSLFLSKLNDDGRTDWQDSRYSRTSPDDPEHYWQSGYKHIYDVNMEKILIINSEYDIITFFSKYGIPCYEKRENSTIKKLEKEIIIILKFLETLNAENKEIIENQPEIILTHINSDTFKFKDVDIKNDMIVIPKKGITIKFICSVFIKLKNLYDKLGKYYPQGQEWWNGYRRVDYIKMREDGYGGIYYTKKIISHAKSSINMNYFWKDFLTWLDADTLIVWKEDALIRII
jgi:hypothetical protein